MADTPCAAPALANPCVDATRNQALLYPSAWHMIGHATSRAARMQSLADPGSIVVSEPTFRLTDGYFAFNALGAAQIKGVSVAVPVYEVMGVGPLRTRLHVAARRGIVVAATPRKWWTICTAPGSR